jgi:hypothetical protein
MQALKVSVLPDGTICLSQPTGLGPDDDDEIHLHPAQVDLLIDWLREARTEIETNRGS